MENSKKQDELPTLTTALDNPAKDPTPDSHIPTAPTATGNILKLQDDSAKVPFLNCLTGPNQQGRQAPIETLYHHCALSNFRKWSKSEYQFGTT